MKQWVSMFSKVYLEGHKRTASRDLKDDEGDY
jgi:hypothetical protein